MGEILEPYDADNMIPLYGFGGAPGGPGTQTLHNFHVNYNINNPEVHGAAGIHQAYKNCLQRVKLNGPTLFAPVINTVVETAKESHETGGAEFQVLLILTDGVIHDMKETKKIIVKGSQYPFAIIIVGVGDANFDQMVELDSDDELLTDDNGKISEEDIVQFVPFREFQGNQWILAKEVLEEIPRQITS